MIKGKSLLIYTNLFFPNEYETNDKIILKWFLKTKNFFYEKILKGESDRCGSQDEESLKEE